MFSEEAKIDLERLVRSLRKAAIDRSTIPAHSGTQDSATRKAHRAERRELKERIDSLKEDIVSWALQQVPPEFLRDE